MDARNKNNSNLISVVIIGLNESKRIRKCIESVKNAIEKIEGAEIFYIDSGSSDNSVNIAAGMGINVYRLKNVKEPTAAMGRFAGSLFTQSKYIMFVDGDSIIIDGWIEKALSLLEKDGSIAIISGHNAKRQYTDFRKFNIKNNNIAIKSVKSIGGGAAPIIRREILVAVGNWNPYINFNEEYDLALRIEHYYPWMKILRLDLYSSISYVHPRNISEIIRRVKRRFYKGRGIILKNAIRKGFLNRYYIYFFKPVFLFLFVLCGVFVSIFFGKLLTFVLLFILISLMRGVALKNKYWYLTIPYSLFIGAYTLYELITCKAMSSEDFILEVENMGLDPKN